MFDNINNDKLKGKREKEREGERDRGREMINIK